MDETREQIKMIQSQPMYKFIGEFIGSIYNDPYMINMMTYDEEFLSKVDFDRAMYLYKERFANPADFTFFFTGAFDQKELENMMETYIASMPTTSDRENFRPEVFSKHEKKQVSKEIYFGEEDAASWVGLAFLNDLEWNEQNELMTEVINEALSIEALETIREKMGGVYSPMVQMAAQKYPTSQLMCMVLFSCDSKNTDKLSNAVIKILQNFIKKGPKKATLDKVKEQMLRNAEADQQTNRWRT